MTYFTTAIISVLLFCLPITRVYGLILAGILIYFSPFLTTGLLLVAGTSYYLYRKKTNA